jgi:Mrp family chromosome partitioning ATPase/capsular polysaccharide biosynthesis protein
MRGDDLSSGGNGSEGQPLTRQYDAAPQYMPDPEPEGLSLRDYIVVIWRRKWIVLLVVVVATAAAFYFSNRQEKQYKASGTMFYKQQINLSNPLTSSYTDVAAQDREMATIGDFMAGPVLRERAQKIFQQKQIDTAAGYSIAAAQQTTNAAGGSISTTGSNVVVVTGESTDSRLASAAANAYTEAFIAWDADQSRKQIADAVRVIQGQLARYNGVSKAVLQASADYIMLTQRLLDLQTLEKTTTGSFQVLAPASVPTAPFAPKPLRSAILGFAVGLFAAIGLAFLLEQFDTRVRRPEQIAQILRQPILGRVPRISKKLLGESALVTMQHPDGLAAEAFRMVRTNLDFMAVDADVRSLVVTSAMMGEGKSVTVANLAITMALAGKKVIVVDADLRRPRMHSYFGLENERGVSTVVTGRHRLFHALQPVAVEPPVNGANGADFEAWAKGADSRSRLYVLTSGPKPPNPGEIVAARRFDAMLQELITEADIVLVDSPAMLAVGDASEIAARVDGLVFLVDMHVIKQPQLMTVAQQLRRLPVKMLGTVVRMQGGSGSRYYYYSSGHYYGYSYTDDGRRVKERRSRETDRKPAPEAGGRPAQEQTKA